MGETTQFEDLMNETEAAPEDRLLRIDRVTETLSAQHPPLLAAEALMRMKTLLTSIHEKGETPDADIDAMLDALERAAEDYEAVEGVLPEAENVMRRRERLEQEILKTEHALLTLAKEKERREKATAAWNDRRRHGATNDRDAEKKLALQTTIEETTARAALLDREGTVLAQRVLTVRNRLRASLEETLRTIEAAAPKQQTESTKAPKKDMLAEPFQAKEKLRRKEMERRMKIVQRVRKLVDRAFGDSPTNEPLIKMLITLDEEAMRIEQAGREAIENEPSPERKAALRAMRTLTEYGACASDALNLRAGKGELSRLRALDRSLTRSVRAHTERKQTNTPEESAWRDMNTVWYAGRFAGIRRTAWSIVSRRDSMKYAETIAPDQTAEFRHFYMALLESLWPCDAHVAMIPKENLDRPAPTTLKEFAEFRSRAEGFLSAMRSKYAAICDLELRQKTGGNVDAVQFAQSLDAATYLVDALLHMTPVPDPAPDLPDDSVGLRDFVRDALRMIEKTTGHDHIKMLAAKNVLTVLDQRILRGIKRSDETRSDATTGSSTPR